MLSLMAALSALLCLLLTVVGLFKPALLGQKRRLNALFIGLYGFLGFSLLGMVLDGKIELSGGLVLLALLAAVHGILLFFGHSLAVLKMSKDERGEMAVTARPGKAGAGVLVLLAASMVGAWLTRPAMEDATMPPTDTAMVQVALQPATTLRVLPFAEQCRMELDIFERMNGLTVSVMARFGGLLDGQQIDYHRIAKYRINTVNPAVSSARRVMNGIRSTHLDEDAVVRLAADQVQRTDMFVSSIYTFARNGDASALKSARDQLAQAIASHKQARTMCSGR
ncbi:hypothetical protein [Aeromonas hydrophila]|uniref:hypothetical protein n=1 Tax=Aeromonas hydrophila TaxID=644 RepID=UPI0030D7BBB4